MGIRKKVLTGFLSLALLIVCAGAVSLFELDRIGKRTQQILDAVTLNMTVLRQMLDGAEMQHLSLLDIYREGASDSDSLYRAGHDRFEEAYALGESNGMQGLPAIAAAYAEYDIKARAFIEGRERGESKRLRTGYWNAYTALTASVKEHMTMSEHSLAAQARVLEQNAYRAITPGLVTLGVVLLLLVMLLYFIDIYLMKPVIGMNRSLGNWLRFNAPFKTTVPGRDETLELRDRIEETVDMAKKQRTRE